MSKEVSEHDLWTTRFWCNADLTLWSRDSATSHVIRWRPNPASLRPRAFVTSISARSMTSDRHVVLSYFMKEMWDCGMKLVVLKHSVEARDSNNCQQNKQNSPCPASTSLIIRPRRVAFNHVANRLPTVLSVTSHDCCDRPIQALAGALVLYTQLAIQMHLQIRHVHACMLNIIG